MLYEFSNSAIHIEKGTSWPQTVDTKFSILLNYFLDYTKIARMTFG